MSISTDIPTKKTCKWQIYGKVRQLSFKQERNEKLFTLSWSGSLLKKREEELCQKKILGHSASLETYNICTDNHHTLVSMEVLKICLPCLEMTVSWKREK